MKPHSKDRDSLELFKLETRIEKTSSSGQAARCSELLASGQPFPRTRCDGHDRRYSKSLQADKGIGNKPPEKR